VTFKEYYQKPVSVVILNGKELNSRGILVDYFLMLCIMHLSMAVKKAKLHYHWQNNMNIALIQKPKSKQLQSDRHSQKEALKYGGILWVSKKRKEIIACRLEKQILQC